MAEGHGGAGMLWASFAVAICGPLAVLSKENGVLLPLLLLVVERYVPAPEPSGWGWIAWKRIFLILPAIGVAAYLCTALPELAFGEAGGRSFTPGERLLTEGRILWGYLGALLIPWPFGGGVVADDVMISAGLFEPLSTIVAWMGIASLAYLAERYRLAMPALAVAIMFFLTGHLLESTWLQLELRFEHRNYVPAALLFFLSRWR